MGRPGGRPLQMKNIIDFVGAFFERPFLFIDYSRVDIESTPTILYIIIYVGATIGRPRLK